MQNYRHFYVTTFDPRDKVPGLRTRLLRQRDPAHYFATTDEVVAIIKSATPQAAGRAYKQARHVAAVLNRYARSHRDNVPQAVLAEVPGLMGGTL